MQKMFIQSQIILTCVDRIVLLCLKWFYYEKEILFKELEGSVFISNELKAYIQKNVFPEIFVYCLHENETSYVQKRRYIQISLFKNNSKHDFYDIESEEEFCSPYTYTDLAMILNVNK